jgi:cytochrome c biogenesis protein CcmG/thiol:disulfide interchange protein DsbE
MNKIRRIYVFIPLILFLGLVLVFLARFETSIDQSAIPSTLLGKPAPEFELSALRSQDESPLRTSALEGRVSLVNFWASWCVPCRKEHQYLMFLAKNEPVQIVGINYKDDATKALEFLSELGDPYDLIGTDPKGRTGVDFGVYGIPETFVLDEQGHVAFKWIGPITAKVLVQYIMPEIKKAAGKPGGD